MSDINPDLAAQEVDEDLRREQLTALWKSYGKYVIAVAVGIALTVAGRELYIAHVTSTQEAGATQFAAALEDASKDTSDAISIWQSNIDELSGGYKTLASIRLAQAQAANADIDAAVATFDSIVAADDADPAFQDLAQLQAATLLIKSGKLDNAKSRLSTIAIKGKAWYFTALEQLAFLEMKAGNLEVSKAHFDLLAADTDTPASVKARATQFAGILARQVQPTAPATESTEDTEEASNEQ